MYAQNQYPGHDGGAMHRPGSYFGGGQSVQSAFPGQGGYGQQGGAQGRPEFGAGQGMGGAAGPYGDPYRGPSSAGGGEWAAAGGGQWQQPQFQGQRGAGQRMDVAFNERTMDKDFNLVSVLYHALQGLDTCQRYRQDAQREGSPEVAQFMDQVMQQQQQIAQRAKELLFRQRQI